MIPIDGVNSKLDGVVHRAPLDEGCEVLDGERLEMKNGIKMTIKCC